MEPLSDRLATLTTGDSHRTLAEQAFATVHQAIVTGTLEPGERLPIEELAEVMEMSPMPIREALRRLDAAGMVEHVPHRGARVTELSIEDLHEVYTARLQLEPIAVLEAAERFTDSEVEAATEALETYRDAVDSKHLADAWNAHTELHFSFYRPSGNRWLIRLITPLWETSERYRHASGSIEWRLEERHREHEQIVNACVQHEGEQAAVELHNHLVRSANYIAKQMGGERLFEEIEVGDGAKLASPAK